MKKNHKLPLSMVLSGGVLLIIILATLLATLSHFKEVVKNNVRDADKHREKGGIAR